MSYYLRKDCFCSNYCSKVVFEILSCYYSDLLFWFLSLSLVTSTPLNYSFKVLKLIISTIALVILWIFVFSFFALNFMDLHSVLESFEAFSTYYLPTLLSPTAKFILLFWVEFICQCQTRGHRTRSLSPTSVV